MTPCARACCWTPYACASAWSCACHRDEHAPATRNNGGTEYADPTSWQAINNVMRERRGKRT